MKQNLALGLLGLALLLSGLAFAQGGEEEQDESAEKIARLERDLVDSQKRVEKLALELAETNVQLAGVFRYLEQQAASAKDLAETLDASEAAGFTFGINPESRHILLSGWREHLATLQKDVPVAPGAAKPAVKAEPKPAGAPR